MNLLRRAVGATRQLLCTVVFVQVVVSDFLEILKVRANGKKYAAKVRTLSEIVAT
jgi:hypothetical protein